MKIDDGPLKNYLVKALESATEADPALLANYVIALLKNNKPKKELQKLCVDNLVDFLGEGTKPFVVKLFHALEGGFVQDVSKTESGTTTPGAPPLPTPAATETDAKASPQATKPVPRSAEAEESSDDEDDDRNHKHRRPRSRSFDKDVEQEERGRHRKRSRSTENNGHYFRESYHHRRYRGGREHGLASRIVVDGNVRGGMRTGYRGDSRFFGSGLQRGLGRGRGLGNSWIPPEQRFGGFSEGPEFPAVLLQQGPTGSSLFSGRVPAGRGGQWTGFGPIPGIGNGSLEHVIPIAAGRGNASAGPGINLVVPIQRARCSDFEERGYCLRGDLCPMEHGANRIVVEDVQSISKLTLPVRQVAGGSAAGPSSALDLTGRAGRLSKEGGVPLNGDEANHPASNDLYDPDQPLWSKENNQGQQGYQAGNGMEDPGMKTDDPKGLEAGVSVWDRIGPVEQGSRLAGRKNEQGSVEQENGTQQNGVGQGDRPHVHRAAEGTSYGGRGDRGEKIQGQAQRTLYVRCIPTECNKSDSLRAHFQKFGEVLDVRIPPQSDRAFVQFVRREDAEAALLSPEAVMGNRFIRTSWANRDNRMDLKAKAAAAASAVPNGSAAAADVKKSAPNASLLQIQKKQEELEQMKEEIRKKQEALAQKRDEFKKRLDKLAKQEHDPDTNGDSTGNTSDGTKQSGTSKSLSKSPFPRPSPAFNSPTAWGPGRFKLDNRTATFRISAPPALALSDVEGLKAHFGAFGVVSSLEVGGEGDAAWIQVSFATRREAEKAFLDGRQWQSQPLQLSWVNVPNTGAATLAAQQPQAQAPQVSEAQQTQQAQQETPAAVPA